MSARKTYICFAALSVSRCNRREKFNSQICTASLGKVCLQNCLGNRREKFNNQICTASLGKVCLQNCLGPPESRNSRSGGRRQGIADSNRARRGTRRALRILRYLRWRDACINRFNRGCMSTISMAVNLCVVRVVEFLRNA